MVAAAVSQPTGMTIGITGPDPRLDAPAVRFAILGPLEVHDGARPLDLGPMKQQIVLALLLCRANAVVPVSVLSEALWDDEPPQSARKNLQTYVSTLRRILGLDRRDAAPAASSSAPPGRLLHRTHGYELRVGVEQVDSLAFHEHVRAGRLAARGGDIPGAARSLGRALRLWRGPVLAELQTVPAIAAAAAQLTDRYMGAYEDWAEAELALGRHAGVAEDIAEFARSHPLRERLRHSQMLALYRSGRQAEALAQFEALRQQLARDLGLRPSPVLNRLYEAMLAEDPSLDAPGRLDAVAAGAAGGTARPVASPTASQGRGRPAVGRQAHAEHTRLPRDVTDFTGRAGQVRLVLDALGGADRGRVAMISGPAGAGKTTLAAHCAHRLGERFPGARIAVGLRTSDGRARPGSDVFAELLRAVGITEALPRSAEARAALLRESVDGRATLFVLDDAASQAQIASLLGLLGDSSLLVTGRRLLGQVEPAVHIRLPPLSADQGRVLLERIVGAERVAAEPEAARRLVAICRGLPLAIRIVGVKLAGLGHLTLARYAARLADEDRLLDELAVGGLRIRPRLAAWYRDLDPEDRATLLRLTPSGADGFSVTEAAALLGVGRRQAELAVERLVEMNFVDADAHANADAGADADSGADVGGVGVGGVGVSGAGVGADAPDVEAHMLRGSPRFRLPTLVRVFVQDQTAR